MGWLSDNIYDIDKIRTQKLTFEEPNIPIEDLRIISPGAQKSFDDFLIDNIKPSEHKAYRRKWDMIGNPYIGPTVHQRKHEDHYDPTASYQEGRHYYTDSTFSYSPAVEDTLAILNDRFSPSDVQYYFDAEAAHGIQKYYPGLQYNPYPESLTDFPQGSRGQGQTILGGVLNTVNQISNLFPFRRPKDNIVSGLTDRIAMSTMTPTYNRAYVDSLNQKSTEQYYGNLSRTGEKMEVPGEVSASSTLYEEPGKVEHQAHSVLERILESISKLYSR